MNTRLVVSGAVVFAFFGLYALPRAVDAQFASASAPARVVAAGEGTYQGKGVRWWARRAVQARRDANKRGATIRRLQHAQLRASGHFFAWLAAADCVHNKEGAWTSATGNGYYGGMQADRSFQQTYAPDLLRRYGGLAHTWPWYAQLQMAYRGWLFRGWHPWPNTARRCGLL